MRIFEYLPSVPYGPELPHYWGPVTATLNWCEQDYYLTSYCAEAVNSVTNAIFVLLAIRGIRNCLQEGHDHIFLITFVGYMIVGLGSFLFHSTLWYSMQLVDELSMIYTTCLMCWATFAHGRSPAIAVSLGVALATLAVSITVIYHYLQNPVFHQNAYAILTAVTLIRSWATMELKLRPVDPATVNRMWKLVATGVTVFLSAFLIWNLDNAYCGHLRAWRSVVGLPWGMLSEGHGIWHIGTATGAFVYIVHGIYLRHCLNGEQNEYVLDWPSIWYLPDVRRRTSPRLRKQTRDMLAADAASRSGTDKKEL